VLEQLGTRLDTRMQTHVIATHRHQLFSLPKTSSCFLAARETVEVLRSNCIAACFHRLHLHRIHFHRLLIVSLFHRLTQKKVSHKKAQKMMENGHKATTTTTTTPLSSSTTTSMSPQADTNVTVIVSTSHDEDDVAMSSTTTNTPRPTALSPSGGGGGCYLRWSRLEKSVEVSTAQSGLMGASSISDVGSGGKNSNNKRSSSHKKNAAHSSSVKTTNKKHILKQVAGHAAPGEILALMGPSGSGKTSLLNVLSGRSTYQGGVISINGQAISSQSAMKRFMSKTAYVKQNDIFFGHLTVRDQLTYTALLRMPRGDNNNNNKSSNDNSIFHTEVNRILRLLRLHKVADSPIELVSGGERKRVNIGTELLTDPKVVLLDEPTSGTYHTL
jgi:ABC-type lipopolysaccharide export system ATPase subunit